MFQACYEVQGHELVIIISTAATQKAMLIYLRSLETTLLNAYSQAYILITLMPTMTSFIIRIRLSVTLADLNLHD